MMAAAAVLALGAFIVVVQVLHGSTSGSPEPSPAAAVADHLPSGARPLPGTSDAAGESFGVLGPAIQQRTQVSRRQILRRYDHIAGVTSRHGSHRRTFAALVRAAFIDRGRVEQATLWIVSVWFHPPDIGVSPQHQWCVDHELMDPDTGAAVGSVRGCLPTGEKPRVVV